MRKKPTIVKKLSGTYQPCRAPENEIIPDKVNEIPEPPKFLSEEGLKVWKETTEHLNNLGMLHNIDIPSLVAYVYNVELSYTLPEYIKKEGVTTTHINKHGESNEVKNPKLAIYNEALRQINMFGAKFGFDPVSRTKVEGPKKQEENPFEKMRKQG